MSRNLIWLSDELWARIEPHMPKDVRGVERADDDGARHGVRGKDGAKPEAKSRRRVEIGDGFRKAGVIRIPWH
jgi:transposase